MRFTAHFVFALLLLPAAGIASAADWHHPMSLDGGDYWRARTPVRITNDGETALDGSPVAVTIGLVGQKAEQIRMTDSAGIEMLFVLHGAGGDSITEGPIPAGATLVLPVECGAKSSVVYYVYSGNPAAGRVPDYLTARPGLVNGSVELGSGNTPGGWQHDEADADHAATWSTKNPRSGKRCLKTVVVAGAEPTWIGTRQSGLHIQGGARYRVEAWVRGQNIEGLSGWYLHVGNAQNSMLTAPMLHAGDGTFDWKKVAQEFTAPADANRLSLGTVLRGTGTAWFDDVSLTCLDPSLRRTEVLAAEQLQLNELGGSVDAGSWPDDAPLRRAVGRVYNFSDQPSGSAMVSVDLDMIRGRARGRLDIDSLRVVLGGKTIPHALLGGAILFPAELPPRTAARFQVYFDDDATAGLEQQPSNPAALLSNLVANGGFETGRPLPEAWSATGPAKGADGIRFSLDSPNHPGLGKVCARMDVPEGLAESWRGWQQSVAVRPGASYLLATWLKCEGIDAGEVRVHAHRHTADGSLATTGAMTSIAHGISGTTDWTFTSGLFAMPEDTTRFILHLTTTAAGTVWHDGVLLAEVAQGTISRFECRPVPPRAGLAMWQVPSVVKVFPDDPSAGAAAPLGISSARNEQEVLQIAVRSGRSVEGVCVRVQSPRSPNGAELPIPRINVVGYVPIDYATSYYTSRVPAWHRLTPTQRPQCDGWPGLWPDPLLPTDTFDLKANATQSVWITHTVPKDAPAGEYTGRLEVVSGDRVLTAGEYTVRVRDFTLPDENHLAAIYDVRYGPGGESQWGKPLDASHPELVRFLADRRLSPDTIRPAPHIRYVDGRVEADFTEYDRAAEIYFDELNLPFAYTPHTFYLFGWGHPPKTFFGQQPYEDEPPYESADRSELRPEYKKAYQACLRVFWDHVKQKGWDDRLVLYISDEPHDTHEHIRIQMKALCDMIHEVDPAIPIYSSTWKHVPEWDGYLDVWGIGHYGRVAVDKMAELRSNRDRLWFTTDGQMCTDTPHCAVERLLPHYCFKYGTEAYEFWGASWLTYDPYEYGWHSYIRQSAEPGDHHWIRYPNGDGFLIYPGHLIGHDQPISTIRLENAREGVEDYEYLYLLQELVETARAAGRDVSQAEAALTAATSLIDIPNEGGRYSSKILPNPERLDQVRNQLANAIEGLSD